MFLNLGIVIVFSICSFVCTAAQDANGNTKCVNSLIQWCGEMEKPFNFNGNFLTTDSSSFGERRVVHCMAGRGGINCTLNNYPWFACRPDGSVTYKNSALHEGDSISDNDVCEAARKARNMFTYNSAEVQAALNAGKEALDNAMSNLHDNLSNMNRRLSRPCFPFCENNPFGRGFPFNG